MSLPTDVAELIPGYAEAGIAVFPLHNAPGGVCSCGWDECASPGKHPVFRHAHRRDDPLRGVCKGECGKLGHGVHDATTDLGVIAEWLAAYPGCNWGGEPPEGVVVLDVDPRNGGHNTLSNLQHELGELPETLTARTGSGGLHIWLTHDGPARGSLGTGSGIDVKKQGGYVVLPPSVHACGGSYRWINTSPVAPAPRWVQLKLNPPVTRSKAFPTDSPKRTEALIRKVLSAAEGERNRIFYWACCRVAEVDGDTQPLIDAAMSIGLSEVEATATSDSALKAPRKATA